MKRHRNQPRTSHYDNGYDRSMGPISMAPVVPPESDAGTDLAPYRYGGPQKEKPKRIAMAARVLRRAHRLRATDLPNELLWRTFDYLGAEELKNLAVVCKDISETANRYLRTNYLWGIQDSCGVETARFLRIKETLNTSYRTENIRKTQLQNCASKHDAFAALHAMTGVTELAIRFRDTSTNPTSYSEADFAAEFAESLLPHLVDLSVFPSHDLNGLEQILSKTPKLERLLVFVPYTFQCGAQRMARENVITRTVGKQLKVLRLANQHLMYYQMDNNAGAHSAHELGALYSLIPNLGNVKDFPVLKRVELEEPWIQGNDRHHRVKGLTRIWQAQTEHGGWEVKFQDPLTLRLSELIELRNMGLGKARRFLDWLNTHKAPGDDDILFDFESVRLLEGQLDVAGIHELSDFAHDLFNRCRLNLKISGQYPTPWEPSMAPFLEMIPQDITQLTVHPEVVLLRNHLGEVLFGNNPEDMLAGAQEAFVQWAEFLKVFLPRCKNMETLRIRSDSKGNGGDIPLGKYETELAILCKYFKLRHLDVDASALTQVETNVGSDLPFSDSIEEPYPAIKHLAWISLPNPRSGYNALRNNLLNLTHLSLQAIFLHRHTEFIWFTNITAKLKNLERLHVAGLVWHAGHDKEAAWGEDDEWMDIDDSFVPPDLGDDTQRNQPADGRDRMMNQALADFLLNNFEASMRQRLGLTEDNCMSNPQYRMLVASRNAMKTELEHRRKDGTVRMQPNPFGPFPSSSSCQDREHEDEGDDSDAESTDSGFGCDPRFGPKVEDELRVARLREWIRRLLVAMARQTGGRCRDVIIEDVRICARGLMPWCFRDGEGYHWTRGWGDEQD